MASNAIQPSCNPSSFSWQGTRIVPKAYKKSERLGLELWDPRRLASHILATLFPVDRRAEVAKFILEMKITGSFLQRYTHQIEDLLPEGGGELVRATARTISETFWVPLYEPPTYDRYSLREIAEDLRASHPDFVLSVAGQEPALWEQDGVCAASGAQAPCAEPKDVEADGRVPLPEPVCACDQVRTEVHAGDHDKLGECGRNGGGVDNHDGDDNGIIPRPSLLSYWTRTAPRSMLFGDYSTPSRDPHGDEDETASETGHMAVSGRAGVSTSIRGGPDATVFLGWMMGFVDLSYL